MTMKNDEKSEEELTNFDSRAWKVSKVYTLIGCFWPKYVMFELKKYRWVIFHNTRVWCKTWGKIDLLFGKWQEKFGKFSTVHTNVSKLGPSLGPFMQSRKYMSLKLTWELCAMTLKNDAKIEKESTCQLKVDIRKLTNFNPSTRKSQQFTPSWAAFDKSN